MGTIAEIPLFIEMPLVFMSYLIRPGKKKQHNFKTICDRI